MIHRTPLERGRPSVHRGALWNPVYTDYTYILCMSSADINTSSFTHPYPQDKIQWKSPYCEQLLSTGKSQVESMGIRNHVREAWRDSGPTWEASLHSLYKTGQTLQECWVLEQTEFANSTPNPWPSQTRSLESSYKQILHSPSQLSGLKWIQ